MKLFLKTGRLKFPMYCLQEVGPCLGALFAEFGYESLSVTEVERQKVGDALERQKAEFRSIEGFNYEIKTWTTAAEGFARMDLGG
jgi:hypothetical protein